MNINYFKQHEDCLKSLLIGTDPDDYYYASGMLREATKNLDEIDCSISQLKELELVPLNHSKIVVGDKELEVRVPLVKVNGDIVTFFPGAVEFVITSLSPE